MLGSVQEANATVEQFHQRCLRKILNINWQEFVSNEEVLERLNLKSIEAIFMKHQLRWAGHVTRMESERLPKPQFFGELSKGKRKKGAPRKRFKDQLNISRSPASPHSRGTKKQWTEQPGAAISLKAVRSLSLTESQQQQRNRRREKSANGITFRLPWHKIFRLKI